MKIKKIILTFLFLLLTAIIFAQGKSGGENSAEKDDGQESDLGITKATELPPAFVAWKNTKLSFAEGLSFAQVTRIEANEKSPDYVWETMMGGAFLSVRTNDLSIFDFVLTLSAYYPFYNAFNGMPQKTHNMFNYAIDGFFGILYTYDRLSWVNIDGAIGMHYMYQLTDEYHMNYLGLGLMLGIQLPLTRRWSIVEQNYVSFDNPNLGSNKKVQPFDGSYQYHINFGFRYSKKVLNNYHYIGK